MAETILGKSSDGSIIESPSEKMRVRLTDFTSNSKVLADRTFVCYTTPDISEAQSVNYKAFDPVHAPASILSYINTPSRTFSLSNVKMISRTRQEADVTVQKMNLLRSWTKPVFGVGATKEDKAINESQGATDDMMGAPPKVLKFSAYAVDTQTGLIRGIPVVISSLSFTYPSDVDYIPSSTGIPVPVVLNVDISLTETQSPAQLANFNIAQYRAGKLVGF